jgi:hypothetical protein
VKSSGDTEAGESEEPHLEVGEVGTWNAQALGARAASSRLEATSRNANRLSRLGILPMTTITTRLPVIVPSV